MSSLRRPRSDSSDLVRRSHRKKNVGNDDPDGQDVVLEGLEKEGEEAAFVEGEDPQPMDTTVDRPAPSSSPKSSPQQQDKDD